VLLLNGLVFKWQLNTQLCMQMVSLIRWQGPLISRQKIDQNLVYSIQIWDVRDSDVPSTKNHLVIAGTFHQVVTRRWFESSELCFFWKLTLKLSVENMLITSDEWQSTAKVYRHTLNLLTWGHLEPSEWLFKPLDSKKK
jgi:hypothetical protein